jgi:branched-chain amino acid transport system substrate-binding protein
MVGLSTAALKTQLGPLLNGIVGTKSLDDGKLADWFRANTFKTIIGDVAFGKDGEWAAPRIVWTQFQNVKGNDLAQFKDPATEVVVLPTEFKSGALIYPYAAAKP